VCGTIVWEMKNTRHWQPAWIDKLKADQRAIGANLAVIVSTALPQSLVEFGRIDGVWVAGLRAWPALAVALREQLIEVAFAHAAAEGKNEKMELLYHYLAGDQFRSRIEATVEAFTALQRGLDGERPAMERIWKEREKQIDRILANTAGLYGEVGGSPARVCSQFRRSSSTRSSDGSKTWLRISPRGNAQNLAMGI
jgi:hypothetical protein